MRTVADLGTTKARLANSITSVDLSSLASLNIAFAVLIAAVGDVPLRARRAHRA